MRQFVIGSIVGALLMWAFIHYGPSATSGGQQWMEKAASGYRGDARRERANEVLR